MINAILVVAFIFLRKILWKYIEDQLLHDPINFSITKLYLCESVYFDLIKEWWI
jgi:hypothetical protein